MLITIVNFLSMTAFPLEGLRLSYLHLFIEACGGRDVLEKKTSEAVCTEFVKEWTKDKQCSYCHFIKDDPQLSHHVNQQATVFISHAWKYQFLDVVDALFDHFTLSKEEDAGSSVFIWFDIFSVNQHNQSVKGDFTWWNTTFKRAIETIGSTVLILSPWNDPIPFTRSWCLFEIYCTAAAATATVIAAATSDATTTTTTAFTSSAGNESSGCSFEIAMSMKEKASFLQSMLGGKKDVLNKLLTTINIERSTAGDPKDQAAIFEIVRTAIGFDRVNSIVLSKIRSWLLSTGETLLFDRQDSLEETERVQLSLILATIYSHQGLFSKAIQYYEYCFNYYEQDATPPEQEEDSIVVDRLTMMNNLAMAYRQIGNYSKAEEVLQKCVQLFTKLYGAFDLRTIQAMNNLGLLHQSQSNYVEAERLFRHCYDHCLQEYGDNHLETIRSGNHLGIIYLNQGQQLQLAKDYLLQSYHKYQLVLGKDHPDTLICMNNVGLIYLKLNDFGHAKEFFHNCWELRKVKLGEDHPDTLKTLNLLGNLYLTLKQYDLAQTYLVTCLKKKILTLGEDHPDTLTTMNNVAFLNKTFQLYDIAETLYRQCLTVETKIVGENHRNTLTTRGNLAAVLLAQKKYSEAESMFLDIQQRTITLLGEHHGDTIRVCNNLAVLYKQLGRFAEAEGMYQDCINKLIATVGENHVNTVTAMMNLAAMYSQQQKYSQAKQLYRIVYEKRKAKFGEDHEDTIKAKKQLDRLSNY